MNTLILGTGWLGTSIATQLIQRDDHSVVVTRRSLQSLEQLELPLAKPALLDLSNSDSEKSLRDLITQYHTDSLVGCFPPGFRKGLGEEYADYWKSIINACKGTSVRKLIMISSTAVYPEAAGDMAEEDASLHIAQSSPDFTDKAKVLLQAEQHLIDSGIPYVILRMSGLFSQDRHPSRFASKLKQVSDQAPANMVHKIDATNATLFALDTLSNQVINVSTPNTVDKASFYRAALKSQQLEVNLPPITSTPNKRIVSNKLIKLGFQFHFQSVLDAL